MAWVGNPKYCADTGVGNTCGGDPASAPNGGGMWGSYLDPMLSVL